MSPYKVHEEVVSLKFSGHQYQWKPFWQKKKKKKSFHQKISGWWSDVCLYSGNIAFGAPGTRKSGFWRDDSLYNLFRNYTRGLIFMTFSHTNQQYLQVLFFILFIFFFTMFTFNGCLLAKTPKIRWQISVSHIRNTRFWLNLNDKLNLKDLYKCNSTTRV